jgi:hypothetical protein
VIGGVNIEKLAGEDCLDTLNDIRLSVHTDSDPNNLVLRPKPYQVEQFDIRFFLKKRA